MLCSNGFLQVKERSSVCDAVLGIDGRRRLVAVQGGMMYSTE